MECGGIQFMLSIQNDVNSSTMSYSQRPFNVRDHITKPKPLQRSRSYHETQNFRHKLRTFHILRAYNSKNPIYPNILRRPTTPSTKEATTLLERLLYQLVPSAAQIFDLDGVSERFAIQSHSNQHQPD
jgi:hypothetical protein